MVEASFSGGGRRRTRAGGGRTPHLQLGRSLRLAGPSRSPGLLDHDGGLTGLLRRLPRPPGALTTHGQREAPLDPALQLHNSLLYGAAAALPRGRASRRSGCSTFAVSSFLKAVSMG